MVFIVVSGVKLRCQMKTDHLASCAHIGSSGNDTASSSVGAGWPQNNDSSENQKMMMILEKAPFAFTRPHDSPLLNNQLHYTLVSFIR
jgi:hypothetical protein